jgi:hypothetical protein
MREAVVALLYPTRPVPGNTTDRILNDLVNSFSRFAGNQQTAFDNGSGRSAASVTGNMLELQVERAIARVVGRGGGDFMTALTAAFPSTPDGRVVDTPQRGLVYLYAGNGGMPPYGSGGASSSGMTYGSNGAGGFAGVLSTKQATLYREASVIAADALKILAGIEPFMPEADKEEVEALRALLRAEITALVEEFGRVDEPRDTRVEAYLNALDINVIEFGRRGLVDNPSLVTTINDEEQTAGFQLLKNYTGILRTIWENFDKLERPKPTLSLSEQVERANVILPVVAQGKVDLEAALDSVAFTESEQRSRAAFFTTLDGRQIPLQIIGAGSIATRLINSPLFNLIFNLGLQLPDITVRDLIDWVDRFSNVEGPRILGDSGQFGLDFVLDEADVLFWTIVPIIGMLEFLDKTNSSNRLMLRQVLSNERVRWALDNLLEQLRVLADLAC